MLKWSSLSSIYPHFLGELIRAHSVLPTCRGGRPDLSPVLQTRHPNCLLHVSTETLIGFAKLVLTSPSFQSPLPKSLQASLSSFSHISKSYWQSLQSISSIRSPLTTSIVTTLLQILTLAYGPSGSGHCSIPDLLTSTSLLTHSLPATPASLLFFEHAPASGPLLLLFLSQELFPWMTPWLTLLPSGLYSHASFSVWSPNWIPYLKSLFYLSTPESLSYPYHYLINYVFFLFTFVSSSLTP